MCLGSTPSAPTPPTPPPPPALPEAAQTPTQIKGFGASASDKKRRRAAAGATGTILTGSRGLDSAPVTGAKTLLGQ